MLDSRWIPRGQVSSDVHCPVRGTRFGLRSCVSDQGISPFPPSSVVAVGAEASLVLMDRGLLAAGKPLALSDALWATCPV